MERATRESWKTVEMPEMREQLRFERVFSEAEHERLARGLVPQEMEDKWFVFLEGEWLYCHRSWTGVCIYRLRMTRSGDHFCVAEAWVNRDPDQHSRTDSAGDISDLHRLLDRLLRDS